MKLPGFVIIVPAPEGTAGWHGCLDNWGPAAIMHEESITEESSHNPNGHLARHAHEMKNL